jgi:lysozyme family protein
MRVKLMPMACQSASPWPAARVARPVRKNPYRPRLKPVPERSSIAWNLRDCCHRENATCNFIPNVYNQDLRLLETTSGERFPALHVVTLASVPPLGPGGR